MNTQISALKIALEIQRARKKYYSKIILILAHTTLNVEGKIQ